MIRRAAVAAVAALLAGCAAAGGAAGPATAPGGYLSPAALEALTVAPAADPDLDGLAGLPPVAPGSDRWWMATAHAELRPPWAPQHFDCVLHTRLADRPRPALARVMGRLTADVIALARQRPSTGGVAGVRPFEATLGLEPCERLPATGRTNGASPATGAVLAGAYGEMFAALVPEAAGEVRRTAREIGWSRAVCRMNWPAEVEAGLDTGARLFAAAAAQPDFAPELERARVEVAAARAEGLSSAACAAERRALRQWSAPAAASS